MDAVDRPGSKPDALIGRSEELGQLLASLDDAVRGRGRLVLIEGEPGIGKSRLVDELAQRATGRGIRVVAGRCWESGGAPAYWPWVQCLRALTRGTTREELGREPHHAGSSVGAIAPELAQLVPTSGSVASVDPDGARFELFRAVAELLLRTAHDSPFVLVLEDLHAADAPSLLLLRFIIDEVEEGSLLVVGTTRDVELTEGRTSSLLSEVLREPSVDHVRLGGLDEAEARRFIARAAEGVPAPVVSAIHRETKGNPLYVEELVRLLAHEGRLHRPDDLTRLRVRIPRSIRETVVRRSASLSEPCRAALAAASVLGRDFPVSALEPMAGVGSDELLRLLGEATTAGLIEEAPSTGWMRFSHALVRDALYEDLSPDRRIPLHARAAETLERIRLSGRDVDLAELAHHLLEGIPVAPAGKAVDFARRAAERATGTLAYEEAARLYRLALAALDSDPRADVGLRCDLLLSSGDALTRAGDFDEAKRAFLEAAHLAQTGGWARRLATAALGYGGRFVWEAGRGDAHLVPLLREALGSLDEASGDLKARVMARLAGGPMRDDTARDPRDRMSGEAVQIARRLGDPATLAYCLDGRYAAVWWPENLDERLAISTDLIEVAETAGDRERALQGYHYRCLCRLERGDVAGTYADLRAQERLADQLRQPVHRWYVAMVRVVLATFEGRLGDAEELMPAAFDLGHRAHGSMMEGYHALQLYAARREQGRLHELDDVFDRSEAAFPTYVVLRCARAQAHAELGRDAAARAILEELSTDAFGAIPRNDEWLFGMCLLAEVAAALPDGRTAELLLTALSPFAGRNAVSPVQAYAGAVDRFLGLLETSLSRFEDAERHFASAAELNERMGARPWLARTRCDHASCLMTRGDPGDDVRAHELLASALELCRSDLPALAERAAELLGQLGIAVPTVRRTFMFTDVVGSTALIGAIGDAAWDQLKRWHDEMLESCISAFGGEVVNRMGDGFFAAFTSTKDAASSAVLIQHRLAEHRLAHGFAPQVRIGLHLAEVVRSGSEYTGQGVHEAARIGAIADAAEILVSEVAARKLDGFALSPLREVQLRGVARPVRVTSLGWR